MGHLVIVRGLLGKSEHIAKKYPNHLYIELERVAELRNTTTAANIWTMVNTSLGMGIDIILSGWLPVVGMITAYTELGNTITVYRICSVDPKSNTECKPIDPAHGYDQEIYVEWNEPLRRKPKHVYSNQATMHEIQKIHSPWQSVVRLKNSRVRLVPLFRTKTKGFGLHFTTLHKKNIVHTHINLSDEAMAALVKLYLYAKQKEVEDILPE